LGLEEVWGCLVWVEELEQLRDALDERGVKEKALKEKLLANWATVAGLLTRAPKAEKPAAGAAAAEDADAEEAAATEQRGAKRAAKAAALAETEPRRSTRVREEVKPFQAAPPPPPPPDCFGGGLAAALVASDAAAAALASPVAASEVGVAGAGGYVALAAPWRLAALPAALDGVGCFKQELLALGNRTVRAQHPTRPSKRTCATFTFLLVFLQPSLFL
jgi:ParB-like chromosome segregation protein Spo0J